jgi:hypothetical protein
LKDRRIDQNDYIAIYGPKAHQLYYNKDENKLPILNVKKSVDSNKAIHDISIKIKSK